MVKKILLTGVFVLLATSAFGEYYQYTDENGNSRFTDDLYQVPEAQRPAMKTFESEASAPDKTAIEPSADNEEMEDDAVGTEETDATVDTERPEGAAESAADTVEEDREDSFQMSAVELNKMQMELNKTRTALENERAAIEAQAPKKDATTNERIAHSMQVDALNAKIVKYDKDLKAFEGKVAAFNARKKKKTE